MKGAFLHKLSSNENSFSLIREKVKRIGIHSGNLIVGDTVMLNPLARSLRDSLPDAHIDHIGVVQPFVREFCQKVLPINNFIPLELKDIGYANLPAVLKAIGKIKSQNYDLIVDNQLVFLNSFILRCSRKHSLISLTACGLLSDFALPEAKNRPAHLIDRSVSPLKTLGFPVVYDVPLIDVDEIEKTRISRILTDKGIGAKEILIGIAPYSSHQIKDWPADYFKSLMTG
jgi:ADP-heptose:LPS heptosyltransferase